MLRIKTAKFENMYEEILSDSHGNEILRRSTYQECKITTTSSYSKIDNNQKNNIIINLLKKCFFNSHNIIKKHKNKTKVIIYEILSFLFLSLFFIYLFMD